MQHYNSTTLGVVTHVGSLGITADYTEKDEYQLKRFSDERGVGLEMPMFGHGHLTTGCKITRLLDSSEFSARKYSLGYRHSAGSDLNLSLTGNYTQYLRNKAVLQDQDEYTAEATIGFRF